METRVSANTSVAVLGSEWIESSIHRRFETIVKQYPDRLAVKKQERALTYRELNRAANRIARAILARRGPGSEPVALLFDHGIDVIAAILGVLKAGKFYTAIDPSFPAHRVRYILDDSQTKLIVTNNDNIRLVLSQAGDACVLLNVDEIDDRFSGDNLEHFVSADDLLLIGYTSGSTGVPKGVIATHRIVTQTVRSAAKRMHVCVDDRLTLLQSLAFGSGHGHLYIALLTGASLFPFDVKAEGAESLVEWLREEKITVYHSSPALFREVAESLAERDKLFDLRLVHLSGAPVTRLDFELYKNNFGPETLLEFGMGSTEARGICSAIVDQTFSFPEEGTPIGYPPEGKKILFLNESGCEVAPGEIGEIAVKSRHLSLGYWNSRDFSETKFQRDESSEERLFLTGDLGRMLPDGFVVHLGRKDLMVKIRGYRVDISEVEKALRQHPRIKEAGVKAWEREAGDMYLAGYIVLRNASSLNVSEVREFLKDKLPDYMIPSVFKFLEQLPLTNGKLDRQSLLEPGHQRPNLREPYAAPRGETERKLVEIWSEVLRIEKIGIHDNFLDLGGHSLLASRVIARVLQTFQLDFSVKAFFDAPTIVTMAQVIEQDSGKPTGDEQLEHILREVEEMSEEKAAELLIKDAADDSGRD